jgi:hypothetical protein
MVPPAVSNLRRDGQEVSHQDTTPYWRTSNIVHRSFQHAHGRCMVLALPPAVSNIRRDGQEVSHQDTTPVLENVQYRPSFFPARARTV